MTVLRWMALRPSAPLLSCRTLISLPDGPKGSFGFSGVSCDCCSMYMRGVLGESLGYAVPDGSVDTKVPWETSAIFLAVRISWALDHGALRLTTFWPVFWCTSEHCVADRAPSGTSRRADLLPLALCTAGEPAALPSPCRLRRCNVVPRRGTSWLRSALDQRLLKKVPRPWIRDPQDDLGPGFPFISCQDSPDGDCGCLRDRESRGRFPHETSPRCLPTAYSERHATAAHSAREVTGEAWGPPQLVLHLDSGTRRGPTPCPSVWYDFNNHPFNKSYKLALSAF